MVIHMEKHSLEQHPSPSLEIPDFPGKESQKKWYNTGMASKRVFLTFLSACIILGGTYLVVKIAKGYRPTRQGMIKGTGLLAANSFPNGAQVFLNGKLTTATDNTLNLEPGDYEIEIKKDGFASWKKNVKIEKELVTQTNAMLFPVAPSLTPITFTGAMNITPSPDGQKIAFYVASASAETKNGLYVLELTDNMLSLQRGPKQIAQETVNFDFQQSLMLWSPDSSQLLLSYDGRNVLLDPTRINVIAELQDITYRMTSLFSEWEEEAYTRERIRLSKFPVEIQHIATQSAKNMYFSPDEERLLYTATASASLIDNLIPTVPASNSQPQERSLEKGGIYVYDRKEDRNFRVGTEKDSVLSPYDRPALAIDLFNNKPMKLEASPSAFHQLQGKTEAETIQNFRLHYSSIFAGGLQWFPDSKHLLGIKDNSIIVMEYDATNQTTLYAGAFSENFCYPWPNGSKIILLTNFNQALDGAANLYAVNLK